MKHMLLPRVIYLVNYLSSSTLFHNSLSNSGNGSATLVLSK